MKDFFRVAGVCKNLGRAQILRDVELCVQPGELWGLLGPSGVGKTTLLRLIAGFDKPDAGRIIVDGQDVTDVPPHARPVNTVFQSYALFPHLSVLDNVFFGLRFECASKDEKHRRAKEILDLLTLAPLQDRYPHELSGGQRQRVAIARSLVKRPKILLLDEPFSALDKVLRDRVQLEMRALFQKLNVTCLYVTHDQQNALNISTHLAILGSGSIQQAGPAQSLYNHPKTVYTARFLGDINIFSGKIIGKSGAYIEVETQKYSTAYLAADNVYDGADVCFGVRPERMRVFDYPPVQKHNVICGILKSKVSCGREVLYDILCEDQEPTVRVVNFPFERDITKNVGEKVWIAWGNDAGVFLRL